MDAEAVRNKLGRIDVEEGSHSDNLAVVLCTYFSSHPDRPEIDPATDHGWGEWVEKKADDALDLIAANLGTGCFGTVHD